MRQVLDFSDPSWLHAGGIEVWKPERGRPAYSSPPASYRRNAGLTTMATVDLHSTRVFKPAVHWHEASGAVTTSFVSILVLKPSEHWHRASGADGMPVSSLLSLNPHSGFGHHALNFHGRMPRLRFDTMSSSESPLQSIGLRRAAKP